MSIILYDIKKKKNIKYDKLELKDKIRFINNELTPVKKDVKYLNNLKNILSNDDNVLPMFDITDENVYFVNKKNVYYLMKDEKFRVLNQDLVDFLESIKFNKEIIKKIKYFDFNILDKNLVNFVYYGTKEIGADITYLPNPAYVKHLNISPYLRKSSIINTALNVGLLKTKDLPLNDKKLKFYYDEIKTFLFYKDEIKSHMEIISKNKINNLIRFFTFYGSYFLNNYLRGINSFYDPIIEKQIKNLYNTISETPKLSTNKIIFRFINTDDFLNLQKEGDKYVTNSFMSCSRKPNKNAIDINFGFILLKIHLNNKLNGYCLSVESDSAFPEEKEVIIKPGTIFKLKSIHDDVDIYLFNKNFLRNIKRKYELEIIGFYELTIPKYPKLEMGYNRVNFNNIVSGDTLEERVENFYKKSLPSRCFFLILPNNKKKLFYINFYDSTEIYKKFYYFNNNRGFLMFSFNDDGNMDLFFEVGDKLIVNYPSNYLNIKKNKDLKLLASLVSNLFQINEIKFYSDYIPINEIVKSKNVILDRIYINETLIDIVNNKKVDIQYLDNIKKFLNKIINKHELKYNLNNYLNDNTNYHKLIKLLIKENPIYLKYLQESLVKIILKTFYFFYPSDFLLDNNYIYTPILGNIENNKYNKSDNIEPMKFRSVN